MGLNDNIRKLRNKKGLTQKELGLLCGMSEAMIRQYELGKRRPKLDTQKKLAAALGVQLDELNPEIAMGKAIYNNPTILEDTIDILSVLKDTAESFIIKDITEDINKLNAKGKQEAKKRVHELTEIKQYTRKDTPDDQ